MRGEGGGARKEGQGWWIRDERIDRMEEGRGWSMVIQYK